MAEKGFGVKEINLIGASGTPTIESPNNLNLNAVNVAISTNVSIGGTLTVSGNLSIGGTITYEDVTNVDSVGIVTAREGVFIPDLKELKIGNTSSSPDLKLYHDNNGDSYISNATGHLTIRNNTSGKIINLQPKSGANGIIARYEGAAELYHNGNKKFETTSSGAKITGTATATGSLIVGSGNDLQFTRSGGNTEIQNYSGTLLFGNASSNLNNVLIRGRADENSIICIPDGAVELYHNGTKKAETSIQGLLVPNTLGISFGDSGCKVAGSAGSGASVGISFMTNSSGRWKIDGDGHFKPSADSSYDIGLTGTRVRNIYADTLYGDGSNLTNLPADTPTNTDIQVAYTVTANGSSAYRFGGNGIVSTEDNPDVYLIRGLKYRFINNSGGSHPFQIRQSSGGSAYSAGVTNNGAASGNIDFQVPYSAPSRLYYQCTAHGGMVGNLYIRGAGGQNDNVGVTTFSGAVKIGGGAAALALLHIAPTLYGINLQNDSNNKSRILFSKNSAGNDSRAWIEGNGELNGYISLAAGDNERLRIDSGGRIFTGGDTQVLDSTTGALHISGGGTSGSRVAIRGTATGAGNGLAEVFAFWDTNKVAGMIAFAGTDTTNKDDGKLNFYTSDGSGVQARLKISEQGYITKPNQPMFSARGTDDAFSAQSPLPFDNTSDPLGYNVGNHYSTSTYKFTCPIDGYYWVTCHVVPKNYTTGGNNVELYIRDNDANRHFLDRDIKTSDYSTNNFSVGGSRIIYRSSGDTIWMEFNAISGTPLLEPSSHFGVMLMA